MTEIVVTIGGGMEDVKYNQTICKKWSAMLVLQDVDLSCNHEYRYYAKDHVGYGLQ